MISSAIKQCIAAAAVSVMLFACVKDDSVNPFLTEETEDPAAPVPDPSSITGLHQNIFLPRCAIPSCHGGNFEPDFRTVQASYNTLVYQPVVKNTLDESFTYRVVPYDTAMSWLHERITYNDSLIGRMPLYNSALSQEDVDNIVKWILSGAKDADGNIPAKPNENVRISGYSAYNAGGIQIDTSRNSYGEPFYAPANQNIIFRIYVSDEETSLSGFLTNRLELSLNADDFSSAVSVTAQYLQGPVYWGWVAYVNTGMFSAGDQVFMRYYVRDPDHTENSERPKSTSWYYTKSHYSFVVQ